MQPLIDHARSPGERTAAHDEHRAHPRAARRTAAGHPGPHGRLHAVDTGRVLARRAAADPLLPL
ncbi:hypothetical protein GCM10009730_25830 [Streptomyces albidochromogenes]|uniref:hypothetical protein n=1 Tax=Streptomyces albidochromogenes TaxID=329524 RepID=UPI00110FBACD|nr:hypothetical protein [Streptomyces albidochromogenes]